MNAGCPESLDFSKRPAVIRRPSCPADLRLETSHFRIGGLCREHGATSTPTWSKARPGHLLGTFWAPFGHLLGTFWAPFGHLFSDQRISMAPKKVGCNNLWTATGIVKSSEISRTQFLRDPLISTLCCDVGTVC